ncbi:SGNH/GDSL hydrolase family protein [Haploplasma axanthum]|nr:SGNH/GDSL hydrolase family protein [Haploplasma axanthum]
MKYIDLKNEDHFKIYGSIALEDEGYRRLLKEDRDKIREFNKDVAYLATNSSGIQARFKTNSAKINIKVVIDSVANMNHMSALGQCGLDLYVYNQSFNEYVFHNSTVYNSKLTEYEYDLGRFETNEDKELILNLPLYMGAKQIEVGIEDDAYLVPNYVRNEERIVIYGTSITQGGCVSRPGMLHTNVISRWMDCEIFNYGFSGSAFCEKELAEAIARVENPDLFIIDAQANAGVDDRLEKNLKLFIETYKVYHPNVPIIIASRIHFAVDLYNKEKIKKRKYYERWLKKVVKDYQQQGENIYFLDGSKVFKKHFTEMTVDGIHPNDLGSMEMAKYYYKKIREVLDTNNKNKEL